ncbi:MAG: ADP-L-glycero-D-manno-heptose-6-epimerase [Fibrobacterota bacterium]|jgi:ADP-L-glycero-D-manno-heptose 6-epimerase
MILVTGAAGFIGSNLVRGLNAQGKDDLLLVDNLANVNKHRNLNRLAFADIVDKADLPSLVASLDGSKFEAVYHQGACSATTETDGRYLLKNNYETTRDLCIWCQKHHIPFFYASSASVYGEGESGFQESPECEWPINGYAWSKFAFDQWARRNQKSFTSPVTGLRYFNVYGPQENHKGNMVSPIFRFHQQLREEGVLKLFEGSDGFRRDFVHVDDCVAVNLWLLNAAKGFSLFNVGTGTDRSFLEVGQILSNRFSGSRIETIPFPDHLKGKYQAFTRADLTALRAAGYDRPFLALEEGIAKYADLLDRTGGWYR